MDMPVPLDHRVDPTSDPTSELVISYKCNLRPRQAASLSRLRQQAHNWGSGSVSRGCDPRGCVVSCWCLLLPGCCCCCAAARVLLLLAAAAATAAAACCCCCFDNGCPNSCFFTFGHISYWYDNSRASYYYYCCIYLLSKQSPAPASSLAEPPPAASPQLGRWVCQQGLRSARIRGLLLVLAAGSAAAAAAAASTTTTLPCLFTFGDISYWYDRNITAVVAASVGTGFASHCRMPWYEKLGVLPGDCSARCDDI